MFAYGCSWKKPNHALPPQAGFDRRALFVIIDCDGG